VAEEEAEEEEEEEEEVGEEEEVKTLATQQVETRMQGGGEQPPHRRHTYGSGQSSRIGTSSQVPPPSPPPWRAISTAVLATTTPESLPQYCSGPLRLRPLASVFFWCIFYLHSFSAIAPRSPPPEGLPHVHSPRPPSQRSSVTASWPGTGQPCSLRLRHAVAQPLARRRSVTLASVLSLPQRLPGRLASQQCTQGAPPGASLDSLARPPPPPPPALSRLSPPAIPLLCSLSPPGFMTFSPQLQSSSLLPPQSRSARHYALPPVAQLVAPLA